MVKNKSRNALILGDYDYGEPWRVMGYETRYVDTWDTNVDASDIEWADAIQFTGGEDVTPLLYGENHHPATFCAPDRDFRELYAFRLAKRLRIPMFGICRGSQFLRVVCGGELIQDIPGHGIVGTHAANFTRYVEDLDGDVPDGINGGLEIQVTSTHHQCANPEEVEDRFTTLLEADGIIEGWASNNIDVMAVQYHPEYMDHDSEGFIFYCDLVRSLMGEDPKRYEVF